MIETPIEILCHEASTDAARSFIAWRKATKRPLTERAAILIAKSLREITADGGDADRALDLTQEHGWQTIKPDWYWRIENGKQSNIRSITNRSQDRPDPALEQIARLAGLRSAPGNGGR